MNDERWKDVVGCDSDLQVSSLGQVRYIRENGHRLVHAHTQNGYPAVHLIVNGENKIAYIHRLVASAFLGSLPTGHQVHVHHIDGNRANPALDNLVVMSPGAHRHHHYIEGILQIEPIGPGGGLSMFD